MKFRHLPLLLAAFGGAFGMCLPLTGQEMAADVAGEIGTNTALLQARITESARRTAGITDTIEGWARFEAADNPEFTHPAVSEWIMIRPEDDYVVKFMLGKASDNVLHGGRQYYWHVRFGPNPSKLTSSPVHTFKTLSGALASKAVRFAIVQGIDPSSPQLATALARVAATKPDYVIFAGNSVSYDLPAGSPATTAEDLRARWHALFAEPQLIELLGSAGSFWLKNDHDFRYAEADAAGDRAPSATLGAAIFRQQAPIVDPRNPVSLTFRVAQATRDLALWMLEAREYRSANAAPDNKDKTLWGSSQIEWLQRSIANSSTPFRILVNPTPVVGPGFAASNDTHVGQQGFRTERQAFLDQAKSSLLKDRGLILLTASNWQYHTTTPEGLEEVSIGSLTLPLAGAVPAAGTAVSSDPRGTLTQPFCPAQATAGFALLEVIPTEEGRPAQLKISLIRADTGEVAYSFTRTAAAKR